jgi:hypothetical protein
MRASVMLCTRNRADSIGETLTALAALEPAGSEIVVVDTSMGEEKEKTVRFAASFSADLHGYLEGWAAWRKLAKAPTITAGKTASKL